MQPVKKQIEILLMQYFRECYTDFPAGKVISSESPDFVVTMKSRNCLGVELTRLNPLSGREPDEYDRLNNQIRERIIELAKTRVESSSSLKLFVKFLFSAKITIPEERILPVALQTANLIRQAVNGHSPHSFFRESISSKLLPKGLEALLIVHHPGLEISIWERSNNLGISGNVVNDIRETIRKKDGKLRLYQKQRLNYYWLIITIDRLRGLNSYNLPSGIMNHTFHSHFQQVFLFDLIKSDVYQLV